MLLQHTNAVTEFEKKTKVSTKEQDSLSTEYAL